MKPDGAKPPRSSACANPHEVLLVADSLHRPGRVIWRVRSMAVGLTAIVLTRVDGDARGAALSDAPATGKPISSWAPRAHDALEDFPPAAASPTAFSAIGRHH